MATDATGTPTSLGIPTYNTAVDAPSGNGFNATMAILDTLIAARVLKPSGIATGETAIWNGTTFVRSSVTKLGSGNFGPVVDADVSAGAGIAVAKLAPGSNTQILTTTGGVPVWAAPSASYPAPGYATTLPGSPTDGQEAILVDSTTLPTYQWRFRWNNGSSNTDKWEFIGGISPCVEVVTAETTTSGSYVALATAGPSFTVPRAGVYIVEQGFTQDNAGNSAINFMSFDIGGTGAVDANFVAGLANLSFGSHTRTQKLSGLAASTALVSKYRVNAGTGKFQYRFIRVTPVRVS